MVALTHGTDEQTLVCHPAPSVIFSSQRQDATRISPSHASSSLSLSWTTGMTTEGNRKDAWTGCIVH